MIPLISIIKDPLGGWLALAFIVIFVVKAILALVGGDVDSDVDTDVDTDFDVDSGGFGLSASDVFSLKGFLNFGVGFCSYWALFTINGWNALGAVVVGFVTLVLLLYAYRACMKLEGNVVLEEPDDIIYRNGTVYIIGNDFLTVQITINGRIDEVAMLPAPDTSLEDYHVGDLVTVVSYDNDINKFYVKPFSK